MFIGHYGPAFAAKPVENRLPLWLLFLAVQWLDIGWSSLVMLHVEKLRIAKGFTEGSSLDLYYMPFTHGLIGALALSAALGAVAALFYRERRTAVILVLADAVFSHWIFNLVVHVPDLPLLGDSYKVGFGLWRHVWISFPLEIALIVAGAGSTPAAYRRRHPWATCFSGRSSSSWLRSKPMALLVPSRPRRLLRPIPRLSPISAWQLWLERSTGPAELRGYPPKSVRALTNCD